MVENTSIIGGEVSFFADKSFLSGEKTKNQKDFTKNSSNPEKIYEMLDYFHHYLYYYLYDI
jgi:hypothetical protein